MFKIFPSGDSAFLLKFGDEISMVIHERIMGFCLALERNKPHGILEVVPGYADLLVYYDPLVIDYHELVGHLKQLEKQTQNISIPKPRLVRIPVWYGGEYGIDMQGVMSHCELKEEEIIKKHSGQKYLVHMLGFTPGFCYLGGMDQQLSTPRKKVPSSKILSGAVGIAGGQTGIYPIESPGGWQIIGRTPLRLFRPEMDEPFLLRAGDELEFYAIDREDYLDLNEHVVDG